MFNKNLNNFIGNLKDSEYYVLTSIPVSILDFVLLKMAICEFQEFPSIPTKVTINEYIELAKDYSTPKSNVFINGILDKIEKEYRNNKTLNKKGRGLI